MCSFLLPLMSSTSGTRGISGSNYEGNLVRWSSSLTEGMILILDMYWLQVDITMSSIREVLGSRDENPSRCNHFLKRKFQCLIMYLLMGVICSLIGLYVLNLTETNTLDSIVHSFNKLYNITLTWDLFNKVSKTLNNQRWLPLNPMECFLDQVLL